MTDVNRKKKMQNLKEKKTKTEKRDLQYVSLFPTKQDN